MNVLFSILNQNDLHPHILHTFDVARKNTKHNVRFETPAERPTSNNRNMIVKRMLDGNYDFLIMLDGNDTVPMFDLMEMVDLNLDVVGAAYPQWKENDIFWVACDKTDDGYKPIPPDRRKGILEVDAVGTGCICIKREVLEDVPAPFERKWSPEGIQLLGQDFYFCEKAKAEGYKVWVDWTRVCDHIKEVSLVSVLNLLGGA